MLCLPNDLSFLGCINCSKKKKMFYGRLVNDFPFLLQNCFRIYSVLTFAFFIAKI